MALRDLVQKKSIQTESFHLDRVKQHSSETETHQIPSFQNSEYADRGQSRTFQRQPGPKKKNLPKSATVPKYS
jgi:hypothetical protein